MTSPTRFTAVGTSGRKNQSSKSDAYQRTFELRTPIVASTSTQTISVQLPAICVLDGVYLNVINAEVTGVTKTIDVGLSLSGPTAIAAGASVASAGLFPLSGGQDGSQDFITYTLGSADFVEFEGELIVRVTAVNS